MLKENFYNRIENPALLNRDSLTELQEIAGEFPFFHAALLLWLKNLKETGDSQFEAALNQTAPLLPDRKQLYRFLHSKTSTNPLEYWEPTGFELESTAEQPEGESLIDKFLSSERTAGKIEKRTPEEESKEIGNKLTSRSAAESDDLITETLAMIYLKQKKYDRAIDAFKKLSLKYPEKSVYFAARIEEIEKLKNI